MSSRQFRSLCGKIRTAIEALPKSEREGLGNAAARLLARQPVNATDFLRLCARLGIDPLTSGPLNAKEPEDAFCFPALSAGVTMRKHLTGVSVREIGRLCDLSAPTIIRLRAGKEVSAQSVIALCAFIGVHPFHYMGKQRRAA